ncbi:hypothetical protein Ddye_012830 [Dipteronia dyeriana]|uniref:Uncharacterized protein n=1 Tax=Dipteronia dyeriana TaxID=168575 RepID=A0AAE0CJ21_9ROSI|nr:hypothetical protein Ddye_012830 [Dipteronia dyeriana]
MLKNLGDSMMAVSWVNDTGFGSLKHVNLIYEIRSLLNFLGKIVVNFNSRASNGVAGLLAKKGFGRWFLKPKSLLYVVSFVDVFVVALMLFCWVFALCFGSVLRHEFSSWFCCGCSIFHHP